MTTAHSQVFLCCSEFPRVTLGVSQAGEPHRGRGALGIRVGSGLLLTFRVGAWMKVGNKGSTQAPEAGEIGGRQSIQVTTGNVGSFIHSLTHLMPQSRSPG